ncbi:unnamed protein product [Polarella glacialis]|uniref:Uncharacterized protein n=1 Tax=Polarella glacialis TaxID=89957 RepID=A0A813HKR8_POLGL|nr:unnamed protein product [Polarella glacialis]
MSAASLCKTTCAQPAGNGGSEAMPNNGGSEATFAARVLPWLPPKESVVRLARVSRATLGAVRAAFEVVARPGEDLRPLLLERVPDFGTLRVPIQGAVLSGAIKEPFRRSVRVAPVRGRRRREAECPPPAVQLRRGSLYGLVEFRSARLCLDGLCFKAEPPEADRESSKAAKAAQQAVLDPGQPRLSQFFRLSVEGILVCRDCSFAAELTLTPPLCVDSRPQASIIERCRWSCSPGQGLLICGERPGQGCGEEHPEGMAEAITASGLTALRSFAGELEGAANSVVVPNGLRFCVVRNCQTQDVRHHALFLRWDVFVLIEGCEFHGKVLIEEGPLVELRKNPHLVLHGDQIDPEFIGTLREGCLEAAPSVQRPRRPGRAGSKPRAAAQSGRRSKSRGSVEISWAPAGGVARRPG